jgi:hypothetical protein
MDDPEGTTLLAAPQDATLFSPKEGNDARAAR